MFFVHDISYPLAQSLSLEKQLQKQEIQAANSLNEIPQESNNTQITSVQSPPSAPVPHVLLLSFFIILNNLILFIMQANQGKDISWSILENFAKITRFARMAEKSKFTLLHSLIK